MSNNLLSIYNDIDDGVYINEEEDKYIVDYEYDDMIGRLLNNMSDYIYDNFLYIGENINRENLESFLNKII